MPFPQTGNAEYKENASSPPGTIKMYSTAAAFVNSFLPGEAHFL